MQKNTSDLKTDIDTRFPDNTTRLINPTVTRAELYDMVDSALNKEDTSAQTINSDLDVIGALTVGSVPVLTSAYVALNAQSTSTQNPSATDTIHQIEFGPAQSNSDITLTVGGRITYVTGGLYQATTIFRCGRSGSTSAAKLVIGYKINNVWASAITCTLLDTSDEVVSVTSSGFYEMSAGDYVDVYIIRDSTGNNDGGLYPFDPTLAGVPNVPSASTIIRKFS